ncbi:hypothetical protein G6F37_003586 [Rhizopus arrhizus]|nr:hypothetical protein G6F38_003866 [Rhizopus arrhizus]KAG1160873.1 hypothetical protein G6F37_003586 [Rhizopus arrhizus]
MSPDLADSNTAPPFRTIVCIHGLHFDYGQVIIRPALACRPSSIIRRATLQPLPWLLPHNLQEGLRRTLSNYGSIRDVGIVTDSETGAFLGSDYAVLDCSPGPSQSFDGFCRSLVEPTADQHTFIIMPKYFRKKRLDTLAHSISSSINSLRSVSF